VPQSTTAGGHDNVKLRTAENRHLPAKITKVTPLQDFLETLAVVVIGSGKLITRRTASAQTLCHRNTLFEFRLLRKSK